MTMDGRFQDMLTELATLGIGKAAEVMNTMLDSHVALSAPVLRIIEGRDFAAVIAGGRNELLSVVEMRYRGAMSGTVKLIFVCADAGKLVDRIIGDNTLQEEGLDAIRSGTLCEMGNILINALMGTISNELDLSLAYTIPFYREGTVEDIGSDDFFDSTPVVLLLETSFMVENLAVSGKIAIFLSLASFGQLKDLLAQKAGSDA